MKENMENRWVIQAYRNKWMDIEFFKLKKYFISLRILFSVETWGQVNIILIILPQPWNIKSQKSNHPKLYNYNK